MKKIFLMLLACLLFAAPAFAIEASFSITQDLKWASKTCGEVVSFQSYISTDLEALKAMTLKDDPQILVLKDELICTVDIPLDGTNKCGFLNCRVTLDLQAGTTHYIKTVMNGLAKPDSTIQTTGFSNILEKPIEDFAHPPVLSNIYILEVPE